MPLAEPAPQTPRNEIVLTSASPDHYSYPETGPAITEVDAEPQGIYHSIDLRRGER